MFNDISLIPSAISTFYYLIINEFEEGMVWITGLHLLTLVCYIIVVYLFVFKTVWFIEKLQLEKGFLEERIDFNIQLPAILNIATIIIGGIMLVNGLPQLCKSVFSFLQKPMIFRESPSSVWIIFYFIKSILGYLLMTNSKFIVEFINKKGANQDS